VSWRIADLKRDIEELKTDLPDLINTYKRKRVEDKFISSNLDVLIKDKFHLGLATEGDDRPCHCTECILLHSCDYWLDADKALQNAKLAKRKIGWYRRDLIAQQALMDALENPPQPDPGPTEAELEASIE